MTSKASKKLSLSPSKKKKGLSSSTHELGNHATQQPHSENTISPLVNRAMISKLRRLVIESIELRAYRQAMLWSEPLCQLSNDLEDQMNYAISLFESREYHLALDLLRQTILKTSPSRSALILAVQCLMTLSRVDEAYTLLESYSHLYGSTATKLEPKELAQIFTLYGHLAYKLGHGAKAAQSYVKALELDVLQFEAFESLISNHLLGLQEGRPCHDLSPPLTLSHCRNGADCSTFFFSSRAFGILCQKHVYF